LHGCYVEISDTAKKIEYLEKMSKLMPNDSCPLQQHAGIYFNELDDIKQAKIYQNKVKSTSMDNSKIALIGGFVIAVALSITVVLIS